MLEPALRVPSFCRCTTNFGLWGRPLGSLREGAGAGRCVAGCQRLKENCVTQNDCKLPVTQAPSVICSIGFPIGKTSANATFLATEGLACGGIRLGRLLRSCIKFSFGSRADFREHMECSPTGRQRFKFICRGGFHIRLNFRTVA